MWRKYGWIGVLVVLALALPRAATAQAFEYVRIGDDDGFGFTQTAGLIRATAPPHAVPADTNRDGRLQQDEFLPDLNGDGGVAWPSRDNFDNRSPEEIADTHHTCRGCLSLDATSSGSNWTDLALSVSAPNVDWPDGDGPNIPNNAVFVFDFKVAGDAVVGGSQIFFNLVFGDYDINPAVIGLAFADGRRRTLALANQGTLDGLIQARSAVLDFDEVFTADGDGNWHGFVRVVFFAPNDPYTAFDYVELSLFGLATASLQTPARCLMVEYLGPRVC